MSELLTPFAYDYMLKAMFVSALVGGVCAFLSAYLMLKGWSLMGDALGHSVVPGVAGAYLLHLPYAAGAFLAGLLAALGMALVKQHTRLREDAIIGLVFTSFFAAGLLMASIYPTAVNIQTIVLGNILGISDEDVIQVVIISVVSLAILLAKWRDLMVVFFDEQPRPAVVGINATGLKILFFIRCSACTAWALQTVGACLVIAMVVTPGATAYLLTDRFGRLLALSVAIGAGTSFVGAYISYFIDGATGGSDRLTANAALPRRLLFRAQARRARRAAPVVRVRGGDSMTELLDFFVVPLSYGFMQRALAAAVLIGAVCCGFVLLSGAQGLVAHGRRDLACRAAGRRARLRAGPAARRRSLRRRPRLRSGDGLPDGEQSRKGGHGDGHRVLRHVRVRPGPLHQGRPIST